MIGNRPDRNACNCCGKMFAHRVCLWKHWGGKHEGIANLVTDPHPNSSLEKHVRLLQLCMKIILTCYRILIVFFFLLGPKAVIFIVFLFILIIFRFLKLVLRTWLLNWFLNNWSSSPCLSSFASHSPSPPPASCTCCASPSPPAWWPLSYQAYLQTEIKWYQSLSFDDWSFILKN